jgi:hypothetical protein
MRWIGARALRLSDHLDDACEHGIAADLVGDDHQRTGLVERAADHCVGLCLGDGRSPVTIDSSSEAAVLDYAVDRHLRPAAPAGGRPPQPDQG